jgi:hypothetical protein
MVDSTPEDGALGRQTSLVAQVVHNSVILMPLGKSSLCPQQGVSTAEASGHRSYLPTINDSENIGHLNVSFREEVEYSMSDFNPTPHATVQMYVNANVSLGEGIEYLVPDFNPGPHATV